MATPSNPPQLHTVAAPQFQASLDCTRRLLEAGRRRIGFVFSQSHLLRINLTYLGGYLAAREMTGESDPIPPLTCMQPEAETMKAWLDRHRPDGIVGGYYMVEWLRKFGLRVPEEVSVVSPAVQIRDGEVSGVWENSPQIGEVACDLLVSSLHRGERGVPAVPQQVSVLGTWVDGATAGT